VKRLAFLFVVVAACLAVVPAASAAGRPDQLRQFVLNHIGNPDRLSSGARAWLLGPQGPGSETNAATSPSFGSNVNAANPSEDLAAGQAETAIAAQRADTGKDFVLAAWNDATGLLVGNSTSLSGSLTGVGFSRDSGATFTDLVGLPNNDPNQAWQGDPTVVSLGDGRHFIVGSLYYPSLFTACVTGPSQLTIAVSVAEVNATGSKVTFTDPIVVAKSGNLCSRHPSPNLAALDKDGLSYDPTTRTLAVSYTRFFLGIAGQSGLGQIEVARARVPANPMTLASRSFGRPVVIWHEEQFCPPGTSSSEASQCGAENEGAYVSVGTNGNAYVAWERNWQSNLFNGDPYVYIHAALVKAGARVPSIGGNSDPAVVSRGQVNGSLDHLGVKSMAAVVIAGYNRGIGNDFPRIAVDPVLRRVMVEWNDASLHPLGDIWLRSVSMNLGQMAPIRRVNDDSDYTLHFLPAVSVRANGAICSSWYDRRRSAPDSAVTDYFGECRANPGVNGADVRITTGPTDWTNTSSLIVPNFGDYTDNASSGNRTYYIWSDGRLGVPQPFVDSN